MKLPEIINIIDLLAESNIESITIIGGEPTCSENLIHVIAYMKSKGMYTRLVTNGIKLADENYVRDIIDAGISYVGISLKGYNKENYKSITKFDSFDKVMIGIENMSRTSVPFSVSYVLTSDNIEYFLGGIEKAKLHGAKMFSFSFCYDFKPESDYVFSKGDNPYILVEGFKENYDELVNITDGRFKLHQSFPLCIWDANFINKLEEKGQITSICQFLKQSGLIFDTNLSVIPCNALFDYPIGAYMEDFSTPEELEIFWNSIEIKAFYDKIKGVPDMQCLTCADYPKCGGGCISQWMKYSFQQLMNYREVFYESDENI